MVGAAVRGLSKILRKKLKKPTVKARGTPTKAGLVARRAALRGETTAPIATKARPIIPEIKKTTRDIGKGAIIAGVAYAAGKAKAKKEAKAEEIKGKLKKSAKEHEKKTKEKREKYGKHHG
jgi:hypothetical protein